MVDAYVLVQTEVGKAAAIARRIGELDGVASAQDLIGPFDVLVQLGAPTEKEFGEVVAAVGKVGGVTRTLTCRIPRVAAEQGQP
ncbi:Lrp/AsnC ligand binding domain-containing protein [Antrihabitans sp. YC2-6]|uniref:Lrp/AsnC ligand binding domain-containing protein n=1 Tax=Antrihabitans sp. YC2-6 TaxID=2799498 RepID=UPI0018F6AC08|nr:Lrp/AsnC ligand binding domain-containing protein [Antrihabitans sp. YC2-6]MBJ8343397.1 Lrp/AsnC family transcriptional regulator [Antrihabitans sp. YC2-6]